MIADWLKIVRLLIGRIECLSGVVESSNLYPSPSPLAGRKGKMAASLVLLVLVSCALKAAI